MSTKTETPADAPAETAREPRHRIIGLTAGPIAAVLTYLVLPDSLNPAGQFVASVAVLMAVWWMTEAIPLAATALLPLVILPFTPVVEIGEDGTATVTADRVGVAAIAPSYGHKIIFLFLSGFVIALAMQKWNLHRRFALAVISRVGSRSTAIVGGFMLACALLSMWVSNTATTLILLPVALAVIGLASVDGRQDRKFATALLLGVAYAASIGSVGTVIGTPPNALLSAYLSEEHGIEIGFFQWMTFGVPLALAMLAAAWLILTRVYRPETKRIGAGRDAIRRELREMGRMTRPEWTVLVAFATAAVSWITFGALKQNDAFAEANPWVSYMDDTVIGMAVAVALFVVPVGGAKRAIDWDAMRELPWGILLLFGGGLALSGQFGASGLSGWIGEQVSGLKGVPTFLVVLVVVAIVLLLTELTSNTAVTNTFLPVMAGVAMGLDLPVLTLLVPTALAASMAFMLPVATPPNAIAFGSGKISISQMVRGGAAVNVTAIVMIMAAMYSVIGWALGV
ncbi:SLC13 family permease [Salininema proteolyticum]|uniref:Sodium-dependent dicarboxylate transporter SdcS n=1 Tax=Salininema proteolyticum TaxID=1607685 RepID=A0ABV8U4B0_9ACTN